MMETCIQGVQNSLVFCWEVTKLYLLGFYILFEKIWRIFIPRPLKSLQGEIILITGTGNGIGKQLAHDLANVGAEALILWDIETSANEKTANELRSRKLGGTKILSYTVDISDRQEVAYAAQKVRIEAGDVTVLINNAGIAPIGYFMDTKVESLTKVFEVNVFAHFWTLQEFLPKMIERNHGHVVTTASVASFLPSRELATYSGTKHAIHGFLEAIKQEIRQHPSPTDNVHFTTAYPTFVQTRLMNGVTLIPKYEFLFKVMSPEYISSKIVEGFRQNYEHLFLPPSTQIMSYVATFLPAEIHRMLQDGIFECKVEHADTNGTKSH